MLQVLPTTSSVLPANDGVFSALEAGRLTPASRQVQYRDASGSHGGDLRRCSIHHQSLHFKRRRVCWQQCLQNTRGKAEFSTKAGLQSARLSYVRFDGSLRDRRSACTGCRVRGGIRAHPFGANQHLEKQTPWPLVRKRTIPTEPSPLVDKIYCQLLWIEGCRAVSAADPLRSLISVF
jgi:hypothetical protein